MKDEFSERAARELMGKLVRLHIHEKPFLKVTTSSEWRTLDGLVESLDVADYWRGDGWSNVKPPEEPPPTPAGKRKHVREMLEHLNVYRDDEDPSMGAEKVFLSTFRATEDGGLERAFKVAALCPAEELEELGEDMGATADYLHIRG